MKRGITMRKISNSVSRKIPPRIEDDPPRIEDDLPPVLRTFLPPPTSPTV